MDIFKDLVSPIAREEIGDCLVIWRGQYVHGTRGPGARGHNFKGSLEACIAYINAQPEDDHRHTRKNLVIVDMRGRLVPFVR